MNNDPVEEAKIIAATGGDAMRNNDKLILRLLTGVRKTFKNVTECQDKKPRALEAVCHWGYELHAYDRARHVFVLNVYYWEGTDALLVDDRTGKQTLFDGQVMLSPTGLYALEILTDSYDKKIPAIQIWRRGTHRFVREWTGAPGYHGGSLEFDSDADNVNYRVMEWSSDGRIELEAMVADELALFTLIRNQNRWRLVGKRR